MDGMHMTGKSRERRAGQAMLITVLALGGAILGATTVAGMLTLYQIRATTDAANSAKAVFAADAGVEWARYSYYCGDIDSGRCNSAPPPAALLSSGATFSAKCFSDYGGTAQTDCSNTSTVVAAISTGMSQSSERAFYLGFSTTTVVYP